MKLPPDMKERLAQEYRFAATKMGEESDPLRKLFFFSAFFTEISRQLNWNWDRDLVLLHWVLQETHSNLSPRVEPANPRRNLGMAAMLLAALEPVVDELADYMEQGAEGPKIYELMGRMAEIGYLSTQHGSYVMEKGIVPLGSILPEQPS